MSDSTKFCYGAETEFLGNLDQEFYPFVDTKDNDWNGDQISYKTNSWGFRSQNFKYDRESITFLGCSHTFGIGLPVNKVWSHLVSESLGLPYYNMAVCAGSLDSAFRVMYEWFDTVQSKYVFLQKPDTRRELILNNGFIERHLPSGEESKMLGEDECRLNEQKNIFALKYICEQYNSELFIIESDRFIGSDKARDNIHFGVESHENFSKEALKLFYK